MKIILSFLLLFSLPQISLAQCFPENNLNITTTQKNRSSVTEEQFFLAVKEMEEIYKPLFSNEYSSDLVIQADWNDGTVNAYAQQQGKTWIVKMFGGLARHPEATLDGFRAVICHEIGHHIAGAPRKGGVFGTMWASNEGQSDYYATTKCLRKLYDMDEHKKETLAIYRKSKSSFTEDELHAKDQCQKVYSTTQERANCFRSSLAGRSLARLLGSLSGNAEVSFAQPDPTVAARTNHNHPKAQCRMDTYFQGALCINDMDELADATDARKGYCTAIEKFDIGLRPACWYKASEYDK
jgi:hypothetical protein